MAGSISIEYRWAEGKIERYSEIAAELVELGVDVIVTVGGAVPAAKKATSTIPIVFAIGVDPVGSGLVASLAHPGGNVTGLSIQTADLAGKRVELIKELFPAVRRFAIFGNVGYSGTQIEVREAQGAARKLGLEVDVLEIRRAEDVEMQFAKLGNAVGALYTCPDPVMNANHARINQLALGARLPTVHPFRDYSNAGGSSRMALTTSTCFDAPLITPTGFSEVQRRPTYPLSNRPSLNWWSTLRLPNLLSSISRRCCSHVLMK